LRGNPTTSAIFVTEMSVIPLGIAVGNIGIYDPKNPDVECEDTPELKP